MYTLRESNGSEAAGGELRECCPKKRKKEMGRHSKK